MSLASKILDGNRLALARLLTQIENNKKEGWDALDELFSHTGNAYVIGVTGAPGTGKSTLVNQLTYYYRHPELFYKKAEAPSPKSVAIIAVDPTSPFTGGAILGDRVRMRDLAGDTGVFIRSMASRGSLGGLASTTSGFVNVFDAAGYEIVIVETVGAGQAEVDIARLAHTTLVVEAPGMGDDIQAIKAGILEIADILVVNKADHPGADVAVRVLQNMLQLSWSGSSGVISKSEMSHHGNPIKESNDGEDMLKSIDKVSKWHIPVLKTVATDGVGIGTLVDEIEEHHHYLLVSHEFDSREEMRLKSELKVFIQELLVKRWQGEVNRSTYERVLNSLLERHISTRQAAEYLVEERA
jgi:LAO/AO transport system kinase